MEVIGFIEDSLNDLFQFFFCYLCFCFVSQNKAVLLASLARSGFNADLISTMRLLAPLIHAKSHQTLKHLDGGGIVHA